VITEGGNLGLTQAARVEYALNGGRINTDAIDNSGGVDCSDHEVNIKILFEDIVKEKLLTTEARNKLLEEMTDEVSVLVLRDNFLQTQIISIEEKEGPSHLNRYRAFLKMLEDSGRLDRAVEDLPSDKMLEHRETHKESLTRPELSIALAYGKLFAYDNIMATNLPDSADTLHFLEDYFPKILQENYRHHIHTHALRREITTTQLANEMVNYLGPCFLSEMMLMTKQPAQAIVETYLNFRQKLDLPNKWHAIQYMEVPVTQQYDCFRDIIKILRETVVQKLIKNACKMEDISK
jgi:glutamate dehydrogenase